MRGGQRSPRVMVSFDPVDFILATRLAERKGIPLARVMRDALYAYLLPFRKNPAPLNDARDSQAESVT
jgi:hypothetical protein